MKTQYYTASSLMFCNGSLDLVAGADIRLVKGDVRPVHAAMKAAADDKNLWRAYGPSISRSTRSAAPLPALVLCRSYT